MTSKNAVYTKRTLVWNKFTMCSGITIPNTNMTGQEILILKQTKKDYCCEN